MSIYNGKRKGQALKSSLARGLYWTEQKKLKVALSIFLLNGFRLGKFFSFFFFLFSFFSTFLIKRGHSVTFHLLT